MDHLVRSDAGTLRVGPLVANLLVLPSSFHAASISGTLPLEGPV